MWFNIICMVLACACASGAHADSGIDVGASCAWYFTGELTPAQVVRALHSVHGVSRQMDRAELRAHQREVRVATVEAGLPPLYPWDLEKHVQRHFRYWIAGLEYAGFHTDRMHNPTPDLDFWTDNDLMRVLAALPPDGDLDAHRFLVNHAEVAQVATRVLGREVSAYSVWRASRRVFGTWHRARGLPASTHPSDRFDRLPLYPRAPSTLDRRSACRTRLTLLGRTAVGRRYPRMITDLGTYLAEHFDFEDTVRVREFLAHRGVRLSERDWAKVKDRLALPVPVDEP